MQNQPRISQVRLTSCSLYRQSQPCMYGVRLTSCSLYRQSQPCMCRVRLKRRKRKLMIKISRKCFFISLVRGRICCLTKIYFFISILQKIKLVKKSGLGTAFFYVLNASFFCVLLEHAMFFWVLFSSFLLLMKPKRTMHSFAFFS